MKKVRSRQCRTTISVEKENWQQGWEGYWEAGRLGWEEGGNPFFQYSLVFLVFWTVCSYFFLSCLFLAASCGLQDLSPPTRDWTKALEKGMATHSSILVWGIPWTEEPGGLQSMGLWRLGHKWATNIFTFTGWGAKWKHRVLITGLPRKSPRTILKCDIGISPIERWGLCCLPKTHAGPWRQQKCVTSETARS